AWFPGDWIGSALPFWAGGVTLGFALVEIQLKSAATLADIPAYLQSGLKALGIVLPLQLALLAWVWAAGLVRLKPGRRQGALRWLAPGLAVLLLGSALGSPNLLWPVISWPAGFPLQAALGSGAWIAGLIYLLALASSGLVTLWITARPISLSRAAQETAGRATLQAASILGSSDLARQVQDRERLGSGHVPTRLRSQPGVGALVWRQVLQSLRTIRFGDIAGWIWVLLAGFAIVLLPGWGPRAWGVVGWVILAGQRATSRFRLDLSQWWLFRQIPASSEQILLAELGLPWLGITLLAWLALAAGGTVLLGLRLAAVVLVPLVTAGVCLAAAYDILRQAQVSRLLSENVPDVTALGAGLGLVFPAICAGVLFVLGNAGIWLPGSTAATLTIAGVLTYGLWRLVANALRRLE
ncbi:MAG: hypothetical protein PHQ40_15170, partial [Anaerolineaceae bacterium]|nr:hypothetical protein [Anaerolineaceae bacterium]